MNLKIENQNTIIEFVTHNNIEISFIMDTLNVKYLNDIRSFSFNTKYNSVFVTDRNKNKINLSIFILSSLGYKRDSILKVEHINGDKFDFTISNLRVHEIKSRPNFFFFNTDNMVCIQYLERSNINGYDRYVYSLNDMLIVEFKDDSNTIQSIFDKDILDNINIRNMIPHFNIKNNEWRINYLMNGTTFPITRKIMDYSGDLFVDHIDRVPLNNTKKNLRLASRSINGHNRGKQVMNGFIKGVYPSDRRGPNGTYKYITVSVDINGKTLSKNFSIKKYGFKEATILATNLRRKWNKEFNIEES